MPSTELNQSRDPVGLSADPVRRHTRNGSITTQARILYRLLLRHGSVPSEDLAAMTRLPPDRVESPLEELTGLGLIVVRDGEVIPIPYADAVNSLLATESRVLEHALATVQEAQRRLRILIGEGAALSGDSAGTVLAAVARSGDDDGDNPFRGADTRPTADLAALHPGARFSDELLDNSLRRAEARLAEGVRLRVIHQTAAMHHPRSAEYFHRVEQLGGQVRLRDNLPFRLMLIDGATAVCRMPSPDGPDETLLVHGPHMLDLLGRLFETTWVDAAPLSGAPVREPEPGTEPAYTGPAPVLSGQHHAIMRHLANGATDQAIARFLGITPRTVTRRMTEIYEALGVESRFQAGAAARRMGLI